ncbi:hypothetical protein JVT61DRAFT_13616 [Boletus reticuloceps]|uniref:Uncharacterized protein n=1 Tax=Boletus reticuloceps TaxID=495285 RepID=A0A8I2YDC9_9AGAM|nr:hypothetical protein JVT61DRAFT_13616 [Boletus reticuloceps]
MLVLTKTILFYWDSIDYNYRQGSQAAKDEFAGITDWAEKLASSKSLHSILSQHSTSSRYARSTSTTTGRKAPHITPASTNYTSTPAPSTISEDPVVDYIDGDDEAERKLLSNAPRARAPVTQETSRMQVTEVVSSSKPDERKPPPLQKPASVAHQKKENGSTRAPRSKRKMKQADEAGYAEDCSVSKRAKKSGMSQRSRSGANNKYINDDLPEGATTDNMWRCLFISALAHFTAGYDNPWVINSEKYLSVLQVIWDTVYDGKIKHTIIANGPVCSIAKQNLNNWRGGFAAAVVTAITAFFAEDMIFLDPEMRAMFAADMKKKKLFLFATNNGNDKNKWTGLWRSPLVLQTFAAHFNYILGRAEVPVLEDGFRGPRTALALQ